MQNSMNIENECSSKNDRLMKHKMFRPNFFSEKLKKQKFYLPTNLKRIKLIANFVLTTFFDDLFVFDNLFFFDDLFLGRPNWFPELF